MDEVQKLKRALSLKQVLVFIGAEVSLYTRSAARKISQHPSKRVSIRVPDLIQAIDELDCPLITSNDDLLLEEILERSLITREELKTTNDLKDHVLHLYSYNSQLPHPISSVDTQDMGKRLLEGKTLLFIGYDAGTEDTHTFSGILEWIIDAADQTKIPIYKLVKFNPKAPLFSSSSTALPHYVTEICYGHALADLIPFVEILKPPSPVACDSALALAAKESVRTKYLQYLIHEYGHVSIFGYSDRDMSLPLQSVYVELKFDPTHPSIKAMKTVEIHEEFKRRLVSPDFFTDQERQKLNRAIVDRNAYNPETVHRDLLVDQWLNVLLNNRSIFTENEATTIKAKVNRLKETILKQNDLKEAKQYRVQQAYNEFKHFIALGHPGSGKTTLSKWLVTNMAKHYLGEENSLFEKSERYQRKIPILIPIWKYVDQWKENGSEQRIGLLQFLYENPTFNATSFTAEDRCILSTFMRESLLEGNAMIIFEGLDEVPAYVDRTYLIREMNEFLERTIEYDAHSDRLVYSAYGRTEINQAANSLTVNRCIITSRIEGNYFEEINFYVPRLTIENMSEEALQLFCRSYMQCIQQTSDKSAEDTALNHVDQLYHDITQNKDIFQLAINPQLASVIAAIYHQHGDKLPENRIDLYEKAISMMIERVVTLHFANGRDQLTGVYQLNSITLWTLWQEIAEYLHSRVEGLSEETLKKIIKQCLLNNQNKPRVNLGEMIFNLVDIFKYQAGLLNEFGYNSFRFIHRTFQEYLAAKSIIYADGVMRTVDTIYEKIRDKIALPNWRVPLSMTFGILSRSIQFNTSFSDLISRLLVEEQRLLNGRCSTQLVPFVIIDSFNDMYFSSESTVYNLVRNLSDTLLLDYKNMAGFARLQEHQDLTHVYLAKLKIKYAGILADWFVEKIHLEENQAPCANILLKLKWYLPSFHQIFLQNLSSDSPVWLWPIDSILRFYAKEVTDVAVHHQLKFRTALDSIPSVARRLLKNPDWLCLIVGLYGGYNNFRIASGIKEYHETSQFLALTETERAPFLIYYEELWGREDPAYKMAVHLDSDFPTDMWKTKPIFDRNHIYKDSVLTPIILELFLDGKSTKALIDVLLPQIQRKILSPSEKIDILIAFIVLGYMDLVDDLLRSESSTVKIHLQNRVEQIMHSLQDPIARFSCQINEYLKTVYDKTKMDRLPSGLLFSDYCKLYLSSVAKAGGLPVKTDTLVAAMHDHQNASHLYAETIAYQFTGTSDDLRYTIATFLDERVKLNRMHDILHAILKINDAVQLYRPVRAYAWPTDIFTFDFNYENDLPIPFFNCLENLHTHIGFSTQAICEGYFNQGYFHENPELIPLVILLNFGIMSKDVSLPQLLDQLIPDRPASSDVKEYLLEKIQSLSSPYLKSRALCQLAQFDDERSMDLLRESFQLTRQIDKPVLKFQVLEKIYNMIHYKNITDQTFIEQILEGLTMTWANIDGSYNQIIAVVRLSFYGSREWRKTHLTNVVMLLEAMDEVYEKVRIMKKLKPVLGIYPDLQLRFESIMHNMKSKTYQSFIDGHTGRILSTEKLGLNCVSPASVNQIGDLAQANSPSYSDLESLFFVFAQLSDMQLKLDPSKNTEQLWINLVKDPDRTENTQKLIKIGLDQEFLLTPQIASVIDEFVEGEKEELIAILFPFIIKPSNEVIPMIQKWFIRSRHQLTRQFSALLLTEAKCLFVPTIDFLVELLESEHDQLRYRAQRAFQHPERDVSEPSKRLSVIRETALLNILRKKYLYESVPRVRAYLSSFFFDFTWDDAKAFKKTYRILLASATNHSLETAEHFSLDAVRFLNNEVWTALIQSVSYTSPSWFVEQLLHSTMRLVKNSQITDAQWTVFAQLLSTVDLTHFKEKVFFIIQDIPAMGLIIDEIVAAAGEADRTYFELLESKLIDRATISIERLPTCTHLEIQNIARCNFHASTGQLNQATVNLINNISLNMNILDMLLRWLVETMTNFRDQDGTLFFLLLNDYLLSIVSACVQKEHYLYRKLTNAQDFDKEGLVHLLDRVVHRHPFYAARGSAFVLLAALDHSNHQILVNSLNTFLDENLVKEYTVIGLPFIHISPTEFIDELLGSLDNDSSVKVYEILKIFTQYALSERIDVNSKSKILAYIVNEITQLKSKRPINYYYTDMKIPFTTTVENELYKAWIKIQGLSGKSQYLDDLTKPIAPSAT